MNRQHSILAAAFGVLVIAITFWNWRSPAEKALPADQAQQVEADLLQQWRYYLTEYPQGFVGAEQKMLYRFNRPVVDDATAGKTETDRVSITPHHEMSALWLDRSTLQLTPVGALPSGEKLQLTLHSNDLMLDNALPDFSHPIQVLPQQISLREVGFGQSDAQSPLSYQFEVHSLDPLSASQIKAMFAISQSSKESLTLEWQLLSPRLWRATVAGLKKSEQAQSLLLQWQDKPGATQFSAQRKIAIPRLQQFDLLTAQVLQKDEQRFELRFSQPLGKQNLAGLVKINNKNVRTKVHGNLLQLFPDSPLQQKVTIWLSKQLSSASGLVLSEDVSRELQVSSLLPEIRFLDAGFILPNADRLLLPVEVTNVKAVQLKIFEIYHNNIGQFLQNSSRDWQSNYASRDVGRYIAQHELQLATAALDEKQQVQLDVTELVGKHRGSILRLEVHVMPQHSLYSCDAQLKSEPLVDLERLNYNGSYQRHDEIPEHLWRFYQSEGYYDWDERRNPCKNAYFTQYNDKVNASKVFIASNLGLLSKQGTDQQLHLLTTDLQTGQPASGQKISVMNYQNQLIAQAVSDANGFATVKPEGVPFYIKAEGQGDLGFLRIPANESLPTGQFDTSGVKSTEGVKGFFYAERNVWRPGDAIYLTLLLQDKNKQLPEDFPVTLEFFDPKNQKVKTLVQQQQRDGFYRFDLSTEPDAPTGNWHVVAKVGASYFDTSLKIENIMPNRLKIELDLPKEPLSAAARNLKLNAACLNGASAALLKTDVELKLSTTPTRFDGYNNYSFDDNSRKFAAESKKIFEGKLDAQGEASVEFSAALNTTSPGALKAMFIQRVFEPNGQFSSQYRSTTVLPYEQWVGLMVPEEVRHSVLDEKAKAAIDLMVLDAKGKPVNQATIQLQLHQLNWRWWWERNEGSSSRYVSDQQIKTVENRQLSTNSQGHAQWTMQGKDYPAGRYMLKACVPATTGPGHCSSQQIYIGWGYGDSTGRDGATRLGLSSDKENYQVGDKAKIHLPAGPDRKVLLSLENGSTVLHKSWVEVKAGQDTVDIELTPAMAPNVYAYITQILPHQNRQSDMPLRSYGILNLMVSDPDSHLQPQLKLPSEVKPESEFSIEISEQSGRAMTYTLALVDEGLLGITDFHVPEPHAALYRREALGVKTWDLFDEVVGAYSADLSHLLAVGGSDLIPKRDGQRERRFKPVVQFFGPLTLKAGETATQQIKLPPYMGAVRVMVVAGDGYAYGQQEASLTVTQPLTLLSTVPRFIGPGEEFALPVAVFLTEGKQEKVQVKVQSNDLLDIVQSEAEVQFNKPGEQSAMLKVKAKDSEGMARLTVVATWGNQTATEVIDLPVRSANPTVQQSVSRLLKAGEYWQPNAAPPGMAGTNQQWISISQGPDFAYQRIDLELANYPFLCLEQSVSKVFPLLYQGLYQSLEPEEAKRTQQVIQQKVQQQLNQLGKYQLGSGQFSYWPGSAVVQEWASLYAGYFMLRAQQQGYTVPEDVLKLWLTDARQNANRSKDRSADGISLQAWRLWLLAMADKADRGAMNRLREELLHGPYASHAMAHQLLALAYTELSMPDVAAALQQHGGDQQQEVLISQLNSPLLQQVIQLELASAMQQAQRRFERAMKVAELLRQSKHYNTIEKAWAVSLLLQQFGLAQKDSEGQVSLQQGSAAETVIQLSGPSYNHQLESYQADVFGVKNSGQTELYLTLTQQGIPAQGQEKSASAGIELQLSFTDLSGTELDPASLRQGTDFIAVVDVKNTSGAAINDLALLQLFPAGWQLRNSVLADDALAPQLEFQHAKDDSLQSFFPLKPNQSIRLKATLNASFAGRYYLPAWTASSMYNASLNATEAGRWVEVKP